MADRTKPVTSLVSLVKGLTDKYVIVDLRNDTSANGLITEVDLCMNIHMSNVLFTDANGREFFFDNLLIRERNVRYVHIPEEMDVHQLVLRSLERLTYRPKPQVVNVKTSRLMQRQLETLQRVEEIKKAKLKMKQEMLSKKDEDD